MEIQDRSSRPRFTARPCRFVAVLSALFLLLLPALHAGTTQLLLDAHKDPPPGTYIGSVEIGIVPPFEDARISVSIDGQEVANSLRSPWILPVDFGATAVEHKITVTATDTRGKVRSRWSTVINKGLRGLSVQLRPIDLEHAIFEAATTAEEKDPIRRVQFFVDDGMIGSLTAPPYRVKIPEAIAHNLIRVTATSRSGKEATDFYMTGGGVFVQNYDSRTRNLFVSVTDERGVVHSDLLPSQFQIIDNGSQAKILEVGSAMEQPMSVALLLDASSSMEPWIGTASNAALRFLGKVLRPADRCAVFSIRSVPRRDAALTSDLDEIKLALENVTTSGKTALYDAIRSAIRELKDEPARRAIVILSDGEDTSSISDYDEILEAATRAGIPIYVIAFGDELGSHRNDIDKLKYASVQTGGLLAVADRNNLDERYREIERDIRSQYAIKYQITDVAEPNQWRNVRVLIGSPKLTARSIRGYFAE